VAKVMKRRKNKTQINKIRDEKVSVISDTNEIHKILWEYFENPYSSKLENQKEIKFLIHMTHQN
jgi:hypothetical protein